jgi:hypothetical protein
MQRNVGVEQVEHGLAQGFAGHKVHHQILILALHKIIDDPRQVGVKQGGEDARLAQELAGGFFARVLVILDE